MVILHHGSSISRALVDLFPNIDLDRAKFGVQSILLCKYVVFANFYSFLPLSIRVLGEVL